MNQSCNTAVRGLLIGCRFLFFGPQQGMHKLRTLHVFKTRGLFFFVSEQTSDKSAGGKVFSFHGLVLTVRIVVLIALQRWLAGNPFPIA